MQTENMSDLQEDVIKAKISEAPIWWWALGLIILGLLAVCSQFVGLRALLTFNEIKASWEVNMASEQGKFDEMKKQRAVIQQELSVTATLLSEKKVELKGLDSDMIAKNAELAGVQKQLELVRPLRDQAVVEQSKSNEQVRTNESKVIELKNSITKLENDKKQNEVECQKLELQKNKLESDKQQLVLAVSASEQTLKITTDKIDKVVNEDLQLSNTISALQKLQQEKLKLESELADKKNLLATAQTGLITIEAKYKNIELKRDDYNQQVEEKQKQIATLSSQLEPLKAEKIRLDKDLSERNQQLVIIQQNIDRLKIQATVVDQVQKWLMNLPPIKDGKISAPVSDSNTLEKK